MSADDKEEELHNPKFVTNVLCQARIATMTEKIEGIKKSIYIAAISITTVLVVIEFFLKFKVS